MEAKTNYTLVGIVVLLLTTALLSVALWLSVGFNQKEYVKYVVYLHESAAGLSDKAPVKFNGVQVGVVQSIKLSKNDPRQVRLMLNIEKGTPVTTSTSATLISQGITGITYVGLSASSADLTPIQKLPDEPYPVIPAKPSLFNQIDNVLKQVSESVNKVSSQAELVFNTENATKFKQALSNMEQFTSVIAKNSKTINHSLNSADVFLGNMSKVSRDFPEMVQELKSGVAKFNELATDISDASQSVSATMRSGKNTVNKISNQTLPTTLTLLNRLNAIAANLEQVSNELRQNPAVIIRGTAAPKPGPGE